MQQILISAYSKPESILGFGFNADGKTDKTLSQRTYSVGGDRYYTNFKW